MRRGSGSGSRTRGTLLSGLALLGLLIGPVAIRAEADPPAAGHRAEREFHLMPADSRPLKLAHPFIRAESMRLFVDGRLWVRDQDYSLRARSGVIIPLQAWQRPVAAADSASARPRSALVMVSYEFLPVPVVPRRDLRPISPAPGLDRAGQSASLFEAPSRQPEWRAGDLQVGGSKTVQVSSGSRREMTVDQNLRLNIVGSLTRDITVRAFLSDDNLPVVPEGNTEELKDIDKVLVELKAPNWQATLGDFVALRLGSEFGDYRRKLQGFSVGATPGRSRLEVLAGSPRGVYRTFQIRGEESNQGPYFMGGSAGAGNLFIIAGSERVTLNGEQMVRGQDRDYVIDYVAGTVTFTYRRLITAESTIVVEYEEGEGPYGRTVAGGGAGADLDLPLIDQEGRFDVRIIRERDDPGRLRTGELGDDDERILSEAGDDPLKAIAGGVTPVEPGTGRYDQALDGTKTIYEYNPTGGDFDVVFFYAGTGLGDYVLESLTGTGDRVFVHRGDGQGNYLIGRPLPLPSSKSVMTARMQVGDTTGFHVDGEWNVGDQDRNVLSNLDNDDNQGQASRIAVGLSDRDVGLGRLDVSGFWQDRRAEFSGFQIHKTVFDYDRWGLADRARRPGFLVDSDRESGAAVAWRLGEQKHQLKLSGNLGRLRHGASLEAEQVFGTATWTLAGARGTHLHQEAESRDAVDPLDSRRTLRTHEVSWQLGPLVPRVAYKFRRWRDGLAAATAAGGFRHEQLGFGLGSAPQGGLSWKAGFERALADSLYEIDWRLQRDSRTTRAELSTGQFAGMRLVGEGTLREIRQPDGPEQKTRLGRVDLSATWARTASEWSLGYKVDNSRTEVLDRQVVFVGEGLGDYNQDGDFVGQGQGDHKLVFAGTDSLVATTAVTADLHWRQGFRWLGADRWYGAWSSLALATVTSRSTTEDVGRLLALDPVVLFDRDQTVLGELSYTHELTLLQHIRTWDLRGKFDFRQTRDRQFADHPEDRFRRNWQATSTVNLTPRTSWKLRWLRQDERRYSEEDALSARSSYVSLTRRYESGLTYNATTEFRLGLQGEYIDRADDVTGVTQDEYAVRPTLRGRFQRQWTLQGELRVSEVKSEEPVGAIRPWFYGFPGRNVESSVRLAWDPSEFLAVSATWFTRKKEEGRWQHDIRLETTARF